VTDVAANPLGTGPPAARAGADAATEVFRGVWADAGEDEWDAGAAAEEEWTDPQPAMLTNSPATAPTTSAGTFTATIVIHSP
jgi:hypothetical protein